MGFQNIRVDNVGKVGRITLDRPSALNALNNALMSELSTALHGFESDDNILCIVLLGGEKAFAAGADIKEMLPLGFVDVFKNDFIARHWEGARTTRKPIIAGVAGFALGGGCELCMMCDIVIAADNAKFGQPEITLGIIPGAGGTQRLPRAIGKAKAMDLVLTGRMMDAAEAERTGLVSRVVPAADLEAEVMKTAEKLATLSLPALMAAKEAVNRSFESPLAEGILFERRMFHALFGTEDKKEGMEAFAGKRKAQFKQR